MPDASGLTVEIRQDAPIPLEAAFSCTRDDVLAIFGPSGSGKTTLLRCIAGLHHPRHGRVVCAGETWTETSASIHVPTHRRRVGFVFQDYALFPHRSARGNVTAALHDTPRHERRAVADRWLAAVHLEGLEHRRPAALSGGQRQRVALARALARDPQVLLLDEPFAAVDRALRQRLHTELEELRRRVHVPILLVTHDFHDVIRLATHLLWLDRGQVVASGPLAALTSRTDLPWAQHALDVGTVFDARVRRIDSARGLAELAFDGAGVGQRDGRGDGRGAGGAESGDRGETRDDGDGREDRDSRDGRDDRRNGDASGTLLVPSGTLRADAAVRVRIPAREVILATREPEGLSLHNVLPGHVSALGAAHDDHVLVQVAIGRAHLLAHVTRDAIARLALREGAPIFALIKSMSVEIYGGDDNPA